MTATASTIASPPPKGGFRITERDFRQIAALLRAEAGISLPPSKTALVQGRLLRRLRALGIDSFADYCTFVGAAGGEAEREEMVAALTTNVTRFFREPHHLDHLRTVVLPPLLQAARRGARVRLWSAGCSTGQEPYTIALTVLSLMPDAGDADVRVLATDIDAHVLATAAAASYDEEAVASIPAALRTRYVKPDPGHRDMAILADDVRRLVAFKRLNLNGTWPMKGRFDAIFCRNVAIYFDAPTQHRLWSRFAERLVPGGWLYIGHSERVDGAAEAQFIAQGKTTYRLVGA